MSMNFLRVLIAALALGCNSAAFANFDFTQGTGTHAFAIDAANQGTGLCAASVTECPASVPINTAGAPLFTSTVPGVVNATLQASATTAIGKVDPNTISTWGLATVAPGTAPTNALVGGLQCNNSTLTPTAGQTAALQGDANCYLEVNVKNSTTSLVANADGVTPASTPANSPVNNYNYVYNGSTFDRMRSVKAGSGMVAVANGGNFYEAVAASQTAATLQSSTGAAGDYLSHCVIYPTSTSPGAVTVFDSTNTAANSAILFAGGATSTSNLTPISVPVGAVSVNGAWKVTTGSAVSVVCYGKFS